MSWCSGSFSQCLFWSFLQDRSDVISCAIDRTLKNQELTFYKCVLVYPIHCKSSCSQDTQVCTGVYSSQRFVVMFTEVCRDVPSSLSYPFCKFVMVFHFSKCVLTLPCASVSSCFPFTSWSGVPYARFSLSSLLQVCPHVPSCNLALMVYRTFQVVCDVVMSIFKWRERSASRRPHNIVISETERHRDRESQLH